MPSEWQKLGGAEGRRNARFRVVEVEPSWEERNGLPVFDPRSLYQEDEDGEFFYNEPLVGQVVGQVTGEPLLLTSTPRPKGWMEEVFERLRRPIWSDDG